MLGLHLFAIYINDLSVELNILHDGCCFGNNQINHILFAGDLCCLFASSEGLQSIVNVCYKFALENNLVFNCKNSFGVVFLPPKFQRFDFPTLTLNHNKIRLVGYATYLGVYLRRKLNDNDDIGRQVRCMYCCANMLKHQFYRCSRIAKNNLFRSYCTSFYSSQLWCKYSKSAIYRLRVAYNNS